MSRRSYAQFCGLASALDRVGERWTLLIVRQLLTGPKRFSDLLEDLPGIGTNLLATRLKQLEADGMAHRTTLPRPAASVVYELTELGAALDPAVTALARWGGQFLEAPTRRQARRAGWLMFAMKAAIRPELASTPRGVFEYDVGGQRFHLRVDGQTVHAREGAAPDADFVLHLTLENLIRIARRELDPFDAVRRGVARLEGDPEAYHRSAEMFAMADPVRRSTRNKRRVRG